MAKWVFPLRLGRANGDDGVVERERMVLEREREMMEEKKRKSNCQDHPYDFHVCGPRNLSSPTWKDVFLSSWRDPNYKRAAIACFIQGVYLLELDRQRHVAQTPSPDGIGGADLAPRWWRSFKYKLTQALVDPRDGSVYAAILEWDHAAAVADLIFRRPTGAPRVVIALRGTLLSTATLRRDLHDDLRFLAYKSLATSSRFAAALAAADNAAAIHGGEAVCVAGHSLGAAFALQISKALVDKGVNVDCHVFNPPVVSLAAAWRRFRKGGPTKPSDVDKEVNVDCQESNSSAVSLAAVWHRLRKGGPTEPADVGATWQPHVYVNEGDYISSGADVGKVYVAAPKVPQRFLEAHALQQWWLDDVEPPNENKRLKFFNF